jgi:hypothetical protein
MVPMRDKEVEVSSHPEVVFLREEALELWYYRWLSLAQLWYDLFLGHPTARSRFPWDVVVSYRGSK